MENFRPSERSTCVSPNPEMSFLPSVPCLGVAGTENALGFRLFPPPAVESWIQADWPVRSGRVKTAPPCGPTPNTTALKGNPLRATTTLSTDQCPAKRETNPDLGPGISYDRAAETLWRTSKSDDE